MTWNERFMDLFHRCTEKYRAGNSDFMSHYEEEDLQFLESIGYQPRELFDFVEDWIDTGEPHPTTALLVAAARRDYFMVVQEGRRCPSNEQLSRDELPPFESEYEGIPYLPRILAKARAKLEGKLDPDLMFGCGGDRAFLRQHGSIHPADFLRRVWAAGRNDEEIAQFVRSSERR